MKLNYLFMIFVFSLIFIFGCSETKIISNEEFSKGTNLHLKENEGQKFMFDNQEHALKVNSIDSNSVNLIIQGNPSQIDIEMGEEIKLDLDDDGFYDIQLKLNGIEKMVLEIYIKKIHENMCNENWNCETWSSCSEQEIQTRNCIDLNSCETTKNKPATSQDCSYIDPSNIPGCTNNDDCTQTCTNCDDGNYVCVYSSSNPSIHQTCVECITDFGCVDGYECTNNICVIEEEEPEENQTYSVTNPDTILDCYSEDLSEMLCGPEDAIGFTDSFGVRLGSCEISQGTFALGFEPFMGIFRGYEIQGEQAGNCIVKFWFLENNVIDSNLLNKEMICEYDSSKRTTQGVNDCFEECCSGELVNVIIELSPSNYEFLTFVDLFKIS
ncbi:hypothetical protein HN865_03610 [Candidatus Woesearchaeota archaeon]|jgi:hypothetical protein|nr:hypothetical protein [Cryomorphaceae bacterium]MBT6995775.1 hypothetical protein [Candidatus Woesearchaeota archaeon]MBT7237918.1 hypothetical protein [Candidatus Woesearchaeota archaeon]